MSAYRSVLGEGLDEELHSLCRGNAWYRSDLPLDAAFRLWVLHNLRALRDPEWVFDPLRPSDRKYLCRELAIDYETAAEGGVRGLARAVLAAVNLTIRAPEGLGTELDTWAELEAFASRGQDETAATLARRRSERLLRKLIHFHAETSAAREFLFVVARPGHLRVPARLTAALARDPAQVQDPTIHRLLLDDGWADLGFLTLAYRRLANRVAEVRGPGSLELFTQAECDGFQRLSKALQAYTHDRVSSVGARQNELSDALGVIRELVESMCRRGVVPFEVAALAAGDTPSGPVFLGLLDDRTMRWFASDHSPTVGDTVLLSPLAGGEFAPCVWLVSPWPRVADT